MRKVAMILLTLLLAFSMTACGGTESQDGGKPLGNYILSSAVSFGVDLSYSELEAMDMDMSIEFDENGDAIFTFSENSAPLVFNYEDMTVLFDGQALSFSLDGDVLTLAGEAQGVEVEMVFTEENSPNWDDIRG